MSLIESRTWDYIIVGTGIGGGVFGLHLAQAGFSVLFVEKGMSSSAPSALKGKFAELFASGHGDRGEILRRSGRHTEPITDVSGRRPKKLIPFLGSGVGGSSAIYGTVLERFQESDFTRWPISAGAMEPYYAAAEKLFRMKRSELFAHAANRVLAAYLRSSGLHPYALPLAADNSERCGGCQSFLCKENCKNDAYKICVRPAVERFGAVLVTECEALEIRMQRKSAGGIVVLYEGGRHFLRAKNVVLAAGALASPLILQESQSEQYPAGIGNSFGLVGRYLMRHLVDLYALKIDSEPENPKAKEIGLNDFYLVDGQKFGVVQSFGRLPPIEVILEQMESQFFSKSLFKCMLPLLRPVLGRILKGRLVMASILEDGPSYHNRIWRENGELCISYRISPEDHARVAWMRKQMTCLFRPFPTLFINSAKKNEMLAHACGTCRMGIDPLGSVVDTENRVHGTENVYVVDSSFFPTSGGTNPSLTIAANAIRVADLLIARGTNRASSRT